MEDNQIELTALFCAGFPEDPGTLFFDPVSEDRCGHCNGKKYQHVTRKIKVNVPSSAKIVRRGGWPELVLVGRPDIAGLRASTVFGLARDRRDGFSLA